MARLFDITTTTDALNLDASGRGTLVFTVTNTTPKPQRGSLRARALDDGQASWLSLSGETERDFPPGFTHNVEMKVAVPAGTPPGRFRVRLDGFSVVAPEEDFTEGAAVSVVIPAPKKVDPQPSRTWLWIVIALVFIVVLGVVAYLVSHKGEPDGGGTAASSPTPAPPTPPKPVTREFNDPRIAVPEGRLPLDVCLNWGVNCGKPAADAFCRANGMASAVDFRIATDSPPTVVIATRQVCRDAACDRITWVNCTVAPSAALRLNAETTRALSTMSAKGKQISPLP